MLGLSVASLLLLLVSGEFQIHKHWDDHYEYDGERMASRIDDLSDSPTLFLSDSLPIEKYMPTVGNGRVATIVGSDTVFVDGVYNGELGESHRARFQNFINARLEFPEFPEANRTYSVDTLKGDQGALRKDKNAKPVKYILNELPMRVADYPFYPLFEYMFPRAYIEKISLQNHEVEHRTFAHRSYRSLLVTQVIVRERVPGFGPLNVSMLINPGVPSADFSPVGNDVEWPRADVEQLTGTTNVVEDSKYQVSKVKVLQLWNTIGQTISFLGTKTLVMSLAGNEEGDFTNCVSDFEYAMTLIDNGEDETLFDVHVAEWSRIWESGKIELQGKNLELAKTVMGAQYYIMSSLPTRRSDQKRDRFWGLSPGGLGNGALFADYQGHSFWDTETWMFPAILLLWQDVAKDLLLYRQATMEPARARAAANGHNGVRFSWESAYTGVEVTPDCCPETRDNQQHVTGDIAFASRQYFAASGDMAWLTGTEEYNFNVSANGCQFIREMAEFWASRAERDVESDLHVINGVMPPDEDAHFVNNSIYTNTIAAYTIHFAEYISCVCGDSIEPIPAEWLNIARNLKYYYDEEVQYHPEYDGYQIGQTIKQADVVLLGFPLMHVTDTSKRQRDLDVYENVTRLTGPAMTWSMHAIGHIELGNMEKAEEMFNKSYQPYKMEPFKIWNEAQNQEGATNFLTGMGGFLQSILFGYFGIRLRVDHLSMNPSLPFETSSIKITGLDYHGCAIDATATETEISLKISGVCSLEIVGNGDDRVTVIPDPIWEQTFPRQYLKISPSARHNCRLPEDTLGGVQMSAATVNKIGLVLTYSAATLVILAARSINAGKLPV